MTSPPMTIYLMTGLFALGALAPATAAGRRAHKNQQVRPILRDSGQPDRPERRHVGGAHRLDDRTLVRRHEVCYTTARQTENVMKFELYKDVVLTRDLPEERLKRGDIVKLVEHHVARDGEDGYSAEVFNALGETLTVITVPESALELLREDEVLCARTLE